ncbi:dihydrodipicolinate synthase family protein [Virgibacillus profundi]|uniref:Dihydrodipicolinate synthase family protein n=1 Tax=Virgibacillus profundi TaxID=2024555 RepID=A0A2A2IHZ4_9BACI|nr:dihydrodipicolinate synthase family protein [Virgibacillus profundi]PAV31247.1 dihydrodipicolinate synthase family protein [Virgibacillus profundi]PXY55432.1 dihydrodipicolinate synthase family protein [Virgibacillus profundi]
MLKQEIKGLLHEGTVIPAHPLALTSDRQLDETHQRALTRYYIDAGAGGVAVGVHTTQFEIRDPEFALFEKVLTMAMEEIENAKVQNSFIKIAGICGPVEQAIQEAKYSKEIGYDLGLLSMGGLNDLSEDELISRTEKVAEIIPVFGFYLQPSVGGRVFTYDFWKHFADIPNVYGIKIAPFNRYHSFDVVRAVCNSKRNDEIALYTGNDDNIVNDLLTTYRIKTGDKMVEKKIVGGLLGHWSVWTKRVVDLFEEVKKVQNADTVPSKLLTLGQEITDANAAFFDPKHDFKGSIAGINEVLTRQGLLQGNWCLLEKEKLSPGQSEEIDRVYADYAHLHDDEFVKRNLSKWLAER